MHYFSIFLEKINKPCVSFLCLDEKTQNFVNFEKILKIFDENSIENFNFNFIFIFENFLQKIEPSKITPFFYNNFFRFRGGDLPPSPSGYALSKIEHILQEFLRFFEKLFKNLTFSRGTL